MTAEQRHSTYRDQSGRVRSASYAHGQADAARALAERIGRLAEVTTVTTERAALSVVR